MKKKDLNTYGKILYYTGVLKLGVEEGKLFGGYKQDYAKVRFLHPIGFIITIVFIAMTGVTEGFLNKSMLEEIKRNTCLI